MLRLSLATKIFLGFCVLLLGFGALAVLSLGEIRRSGDDLRALKDGQLVLARLSTQLETLQQNRFRDLRRALEEPDPKARQILLRISLAYFPDVVQSTLDELKARVTARRATGGDPAFLDAVLAHARRLGEGHRALDTLTQAWMEGAEQAPQEPLEALESELRSETYLLDKRISDQTERAVRRAVAQERRAVWRILAMTVLAMAVGLLVTALAARALAPISHLVRYARAISRGDYRQPLDVSSKGEFGHLAEELMWMARAQQEREKALDRGAAELEQAYRRVEALKRYHEGIVRSLRTGVVVVDEALRISSANPAARSVWGLEPSPLAPIDDTELGRALAEREPDWAEGGGCTLSNVPIAQRLADVVVAPFVDEQGAQRGRLIALEDVTDAVRTKEALIRSERLAAIGRMSAHVTHEIRNPLSSIGLNAEMLKDWVTQQPDSLDAQQLCAAIEQEIDRLTELTDEYLRFARLPAPELRTVELGAFLATLTSFVGPECRAAGVTVSLQVQPGLKVAMDPDQMRQAVLNLIRNAKEAMPSGGRIQLSTQADGDRVRLAIEDEGGGIDEADLPRIFDPFYSTKLTGTGLGLALVQQIVQEHGGDLEVSRRDSMGTRFTLTLKGIQGEDERSSDPRDVTDPETQVLAS